MAAIEVELLHRRMGHMGRATLARLERDDLVRRLKGGLVGLGECHGCELGKAQSRTHPSVDVTWKATKHPEMLHADLVGPIKELSWGGARYIFVLVDDISRKSWVILLKQKLDVEARLGEWKVLVEAKSGEKLQRFRTNNGGEFKSSSLKEKLKLKWGK